MRIIWPWLLLAWPLAAAAQTDGVLSGEMGQHEFGRGVYNAECYFCHGYSGDARTLASAYLNPPPRNFKQLSIDDLSKEAMLRAVREGRPGSAMMSFSGKLSDAEIDAVVAFIRGEFMRHKRVNTRYHSMENGWFPAEASAAMPFASGEISMDTPWGALSAREREGKRVFLSSCVTCHDLGLIPEAGPVWRPEAVSYPPGGYAHTALEAGAESLPYYERHEQAPTLATRSPEERRGEQLFQANCVACHAADGTGRNWVGSFLRPPPPDFSDPLVRRAWAPEQLARVIRDGAPGTAMPAWRHVLNEDEITAIVSYVLQAFAP